MDQTFTVGGQKVNLAEVARGLEEAQRQGRREYELQTAALKHSIEHYEQELVKLARDREAGRIGQLEFETRTAQVKRKIDASQRDVDSMNKHVEAVTGIITNVVAQGTEVVMASLKEDATRKTQIAVAAASAAARQEIDNKGSLARLQLLTSPENMKRYGLTAASTGLALFAAWHACTFLTTYAESFIGMPTLVRDSSDKGLLGGIKEWFSGTNDCQDLFAGIIFPNPDVESAVTRIALSTLGSKMNGVPQRGVIFYGPPGTGKTLMAKAIAKRSECGYAIISGSDLSQFGPGAVQQLHALLDRAELQAEKDGCFFVVIDEADSCLGTRQGSTDVSGESRKVLNAYLQRTGAKSKVKIILITNDLQALDPAVRDRASEQVLIPLHDLDGRAKVLAHYLHTYYGKENTAGLSLSLEVSDGTYLHKLAEQLEGFSGRQLEDLVGLVQDQSLLRNSKIITIDSIEAALKEKLKQQKLASSYKF